MHRFFVDWKSKFILKLLGHYLCLMIGGGVPSILALAHPWYFRLTTPHSRLPKNDCPNIAFSIRDTYLVTCAMFFPLSVWPNRWLPRAAYTPSAYKHGLYWLRRLKFWCLPNRIFGWAIPDIAFKLRRARRDTDIWSSKQYVHSADWLYGYRVFVDACFHFYHVVATKVLHWKCIASTSVLWPVKLMNVD